MGDTAMRDELAAIDTSALEKLTRLKSEVETLDQRLEAMEERKDQVAEAVYKRVRADYEARRRTLEQESAPLKAAAREEYVKLFALLSRSEADHEAARLDREEADFRHALGEYDDDEYKKRIEEIDDQLKAKSEAREQALEMRDRFVAAFKSEDELRQAVAKQTVVTPPPAAEATQPPPASAPPAPPPAAAVEETVRMKPLTPEQLAAAGLSGAEGAATPPTNKVVDPGATQTMRTLKGNGNGNAAPRADQTVVIRGARLVPQNPEAGKITHTVGLKPVMLGSGDQCDIRIAGSMPHHAEIRVSMAGYTVSDLGGGVRINGVAIEQHLLRHDDVLEIGPARFTFREG
ncbi:FHA domain-containing protein [Pseudomarimonas salicorniae]|uniref:FHA domain-containing protein n=1 Tax=Pseudomarimonas salicorniae TaxID=2933270 RepID=A0ABT0GC32_9GAMM|nr:FHA domain-containing protein [Lysobacter sp. CAU 1642]MCK7592096.1 FHA domain-containing protein [Lysobacter sp. CAU 1642]